MRDIKIAATGENVSILGVEHSSEFTMQTTATHDYSQTIGKNHIRNFQVQVQRDLCEMVL